MGVVSANISIFAAVAEREHTLTLATILLPTLDVLLLKNWKLKNRGSLNKLYIGVAWSKFNIEIPLKGFYFQLWVLEVVLLIVIYVTTISFFKGYYINNIL